MSTTFYADDNGVILGGFGDGATPPAGAVACLDANGAPVFPDDSRQTWDAATRTFVALTDAQRASGMELRKRAFLTALDAFLLARGDYAVTEPLPIDAWLEGRIAASTALDAATKRTAITALRGAVEFQRADPLIDALGLAVLGMTASQIDTVFLSAS